MCLRILENEYMKSEIRKYLSNAMYLTDNLFGDEIYWSSKDKSESEIKVEIKDKSLIIKNMKKYPNQKAIAPFTGWDSIFEMVREIDKSIEMYW